jgi:peptide/nickel transport system permease protein
MNLRFVLTKMFRALLTLWIVVTFAFVIMHASGDPIEIMLGDQAEQEVIDHYKELYGLDRPMHEQYYRYVLGILQGDLGYSLSDQRPVTELLVEAIPATLELGLTALVISMVVGIPLGIIAALNRNKPIDRFVMTFAVLGFSIPNFFLGILLILLFSMTLRWLPTAGMGSWQHVLNKLYMRTAVAKGVPRGRRIRWHALPNAAIPLVTVLGFRLGDLVAGSIITETVFAWPGVGRALVSAVTARDLAVVQGVLLMTACTMVVANLLVDLTYGWIDPRIRASKTSPSGA